MKKRYMKDKRLLEEEAIQKRKGGFMKAFRSGGTSECESCLILLSDNYVY